MRSLGVEMMARLHARVSAEADSNDVRRQLMRRARFLFEALCLVVGLIGSLITIAPVARAFSRGISRYAGIAELATRPPIWFALLAVVLGVTGIVVAARNVAMPLVPLRRGTTRFVSGLLGVCLLCGGASFLWVGSSSLRLQPDGSEDPPGALLSKAPSSGDARLNSLGSEADFLRVRLMGGAWTNELIAREGDVIEVSTSFQNDAPSTTAAGTAVHVAEEWTDYKGGEFPLRAYLDAFNAPTVTDTAKVSVNDSNASLAYMPGSARLWTSSQRGAVLPDGIFESGVDLGSVAGEIGGYVTFTLRVVGSKSSQDAQALGTSLWVGNVTNGTEYQPFAVAKVDDVLKLELAYWSMGARSPDAVEPVKNVRAKIVLEPMDETTGLIANSSVWGSRTTVARDVTAIRTYVPASLEYIPGSAYWRHNVGSIENPDWKTVKVSDALVRGGVALGDIKPYWEDQGTLTILVRVVKIGANR